MPSYTDFDFTNRLRTDLLSRTLDPVYGNYISPKNFTRENYQVRSLTYSANIDQPPVDASRTTDLNKPKTKNTYKPDNFTIYENLQDLPRRANLKLYPYFVQSHDGIIGIMTTSSYDNESELFKFAARHIKTEKTGPVLSRIQQNLYTSTLGRVRILDAIEGNTGSLVGILKGTQPLVESNNKITVAKSIPGKVIDFVQTVAGVQSPFPEIPGDYLTNPRNPVNVRPTQTTLATKVWQDLSGVLGSLVGIDRRPLPSRKPSDLLIEHMGSGQKNVLFDLLSYSKYAPNYTTLARSQQSTKLFNFPNMIAQGVKRVLGTEAPNGLAYIGDDRGNDVKNATTDLISGRVIKSTYYQTILFDPELGKIKQGKPFSNGGSISGPLTWISTKSENKIGKFSNSTNEEKTKLDDSLSKKYKFRESSILETTQQILETLPKGGEGRSHIANVIDQTSRFFQEGDQMISKGSEVRYLANGRDIGVEYARVWTKDRPYLKMSDTMPFYKETDDRPYYKKTERPYRRTNIRRFDGSVMSDTWNLNIGPMSNGNKDFSGSSNIFKADGSDTFYAKKYMLSIENLAWKTSTAAGFTVSDLPFCERGPNGGRVMWFPPYDLSVSEQNSATWDKNTFLGRPEPIYTYQGTERSGQLKFKIVVDHPSVLNLLVREHFKNMSDEQADQYINSFFAGAKDIDFYSLIRTYTTLDSSDIDLIKRYLNEDGKEQNANSIKPLLDPPVTDQPTNGPNPQGAEENVEKEFILNFPKDNPTGANAVSSSDYTVMNNQLKDLENLASTELNNNLTTLINSGTENDNNIVFGKKLSASESGTTITSFINELTTTFQNINVNKSDFDDLLDTIVEEIKSKSVKDFVIKVGSNTSDLSDVDATHLTSLRRSHSIFKYIISKISTAPVSEFDDLWSNFENKGGSSFGEEKMFKEIDIPFKKLGYPDNIQGNLLITFTGNGKKVANKYHQDCNQKNYDNVDLKKFTPKAFGCRTSTVKLSYKKTNKIDPPQPVVNPTQIQIQSNSSTNNRPPVDVMKRIIMKTLSECYYFKKLEETSPIQFNSLKEKLRYFHPAFHSMTPEGLNSRLTFLNQCVRPGDTIPTKGLADSSDINARNTSFGPPPICILRVGDFYHSKVIIKDMNITFDENIWDMNPDGIGVQPMIANVQLQINFLGGHGLEKPIERLQNALSSNFYANTEMYDERSISTATKIGGKDAKEFTKEFLQNLYNDNLKQAKAKEVNGVNTAEGQYVGTLSGSTLDYTSLIDSLFTNVKNYFDSYEKAFDILFEKYGSDLVKLLLHPDYRTIKTMDIKNGGSNTTIELFGLYPNTFDVAKKQQEIRQKLQDYYDDNSNSFVKLFGLDEVLPSENATEVEEYIYGDYELDVVVDDKLSDILTFTNTTISELESNRNKIIEIIDKLNFVVENQYDVKLEKNVTTKAVLSTFNAQDFYKNYDDCIDFIKNNSTKLYNKIDSDLNFLSITLTTDQVKRLTAELTADKETDLYNKIIENFSSYSEELKRKIKNQIQKYYNRNTPRKPNIRIGRFRNRKNSKKITYTISLFDQINTTDEIIKLFSTKNSEVTSKLNYYRK